MLKWMQHVKCSLLSKRAFFFHFMSYDRLVCEAGAFQEKSGIMSVSALLLAQEQGYQ